MTGSLGFGLAKSMVDGALTNVKSAIQEEAKLRHSAKHDLALITGELEMMRSFFVVATTERIEDQVGLTWVRQVRDLSSDAEDCIEFILHLDNKTRWWWRMVPPCMAPAMPLDEAVDEIEQLKIKMGSVCTRNERYRLNGGTPAGGMPTAPAAAASSMLARARDAATARRQQGLGDLTQLITNKDNTDPQLQVISVWGGGGDLGTTSIIRKAYTDPEICQRFACRAWVKLTHPFNPHDFVRRFMAQIYAADAGGAGQLQGADVGAHVLTKMKAKQEHLLREFVHHVNTKTYLIVLENLTDMPDWDAVRTFLPDMRNGSWIIVSTQQFEIASLCVGHSSQPMELKHFSHDHSVCAFFKKGCQHHGGKDEETIVSKVSQNSSYGEIPSDINVAVDWMRDHPLVGRESEMNKLGNCTAMARLGDSRVVSVWGIPGIGKSALVGNLYCDRMIHSNQFNKYSWVDVSHPFNIRDFSRSLLLDFHSERDPIRECHELLTRHQCLIVIDGLQSKEQWDLIQAAFASRPSKSVIIVITTEARVASYCANDKEQVLNVKGLETAAAFDLFRKEVHKRDSSSSLNGLKDMALDELISKCGGLPKVIIAIAALLATRTVGLMDTVHSLNHRFMHHLETNMEYDSLRALFGWMHSYFRDCPDSLKPCIFYLSIFPQGCNIRRRRLIRRWIAEGYSRDSDKRSAEEQGEKFFSKLLELSIIQQIPELGTSAFSETRMVRCRVTGFIREYIVSRRMEENLVFELGPSCVLTTQRTGSHLIILRDWDRDEIVFKHIDFSRLQSMTVFGKWEPFFISKSMRLVRVLDLEDVFGVVDDDLRKIVRRLRRLKFVSLRGCSDIFHLPSSLGDLSQLQSLDVRHTSIVTLPASITKLEKLQYIRGGTSVPTSIQAASSGWLREFRRRHGLVGVEVPRGIGKLTALHTLGVVNIGASGGKATVEELKKLTQLRKLGVSGVNRHNSREFLSAISGHVHLESLLVRLDKDSQGCLDLDDTSLPLENLQSLKLYGLQDKLPLSMTNLNKLRKLYLEMATLEPSDIAFLAKLPELCILRLRVMPLQDGKLHFYSELYGQQLDTFKTLKILEIGCSSSDLHVTFGSKSMKFLELLKLDCSSVSYQLTGLNYLSEIKVVLLKGTNDETIKAHLQSQLDNHPKKPAVKLEELPCSS